ncbi:MAG: ABC transporter substrate-binding protein [bacterium]|nr:ABC transporter substrate-binding protein [bacterium]
MMARSRLAAYCFLAALPAALLLAVSCGSNAGGAHVPFTELPEGASTRAGQVTPSGKTLGGLMRVNESAQPRSLDPVRTGESSATAVCTQIYDALVNLDPNLEIVPGLAESYEISDDGLLYTFHIRKGVRFHDDPCFPGGEGRELTAHDIDYSFSRLLDDTTQSTGAWVFLDVVIGAEAFHKKEAQRVEGFEIPDDYTFSIRLHTPFTSFIQRLAMTYCYITAPEAVKYYGEDFFQHPVGTGPFRYVHWLPGREILMVRNDHYWRTDADGVRLPYLDGVRFTFIPDFKIEFIEFDSGNLDRLYSIPEDLWLNVMDEDGNVRPEYQKYQILNKELMVSQYYGFNVTKKPYDDKRVRQAFNYAIDRQAIIDYVLFGAGAPARSIVPRTMPHYQSVTEGYGYHPDKAKALLAEAGYPGGEGLGELTLDLNSGGTTNEVIAEAIQDQLADSGVTLRLRIVEWAQHLDNVDEGKSSFFRLGWIADYPDPENFLACLWGKNFTPKGTNYARYANPEYDRLFEEAGREGNPARREKLYQQAEQIAWDDAPWLFIYFTRRYSMIQPYVRDYVLNAQERPVLVETWLQFPEED